MAALAWLLIPLVAAIGAGLWGGWASRNRRSIEDGTELQSRRLNEGATLGPGVAVSASAVTAARSSTPSSYTCLANGSISGDTRLPVA